jgi:hypothetical protein
MARISRPRLSLARQKWVSLNKRLDILAEKCRTLILVRASALSLNWPGLSRRENIPRDNGEIIDPNQSEIEQQWVIHMHQFHEGRMQMTTASRQLVSGG